MTIPAHDMAIFLRDQAVGNLGGTLDWAIRIGKEPTSPDRSITLYDTGGDPNPKFLLDQSTIQIRIRGAKQDYQITYLKALDIKNQLLSFPKQIVNGTLYIGIWPMGDIVYIGHDDNDRPLFTSNWRLGSEPTQASPETNRQSF